MARHVRAVTVSGVPTMRIARLRIAAHVARHRWHRWRDHLTHHLRAMAAGPHGE
jgi:hypothetical protein